MVQATERRPYASAALAGMLMLILLYGPILIQPNRWMFSQNGDGLKNYYTYAYHIRHDASFTHHDGMNYPYGEHYLYIDGHPLPANALKALSQILPISPEYSIACLHWMLLFSIPIAVVCFTAVLRHYRIRSWLAILFALGTIALSPQIFRIDGHFALSYSMALPLSWWLYLRCQAKPTLGRHMILLLNGWIWLFVHAYLGMIVLSWLLAVWAFQWRAAWRLSTSKWQHVGLSFALLLPVALFYLHVGLTDTHWGRTDNPSGFFLYNAELDDVLIAPKGWFHDAVKSIPGVRLRLQWEACGYLGFFNVLAILLLVLAWLWRRQVPSHHVGLQFRAMAPFLLAALILLLFAMGVPFKSFPEWLDHFPILKQFRATGRFVWPLYFVVGAAVALAIENLWRRASAETHLHRLALWCTASYVLLQTSEAWSYHWPMRQKMMETTNPFVAQNLTSDMQNALQELRTTPYQAIISLPFFYQGSESYSRPLHDDAVSNTLLLSYHSGIPTVCANLTRTSVNESKRIIQLVSAPYYNKPIRHDFPNEKPFLILKTHLPLTANETTLLQQAECVYHGESFDLYRLNFHAAFENQAPRLMEQFNNQRGSLHRHGPMLTTTPEDKCYLQTFDGLSQPIRHRGVGAFGGFKKGENNIAEWKPNAVDTSVSYHVSMWMHNGEQDALNMWFPISIEAIDANGQIVQTLRIFPDQAETIDGDWSLVEGEFQWKDPNTTLRIRSVGHPLSKARLYVDDLLIRPTNVDVWVESQDAGLSYNNHWIKGH